jgi:hypothetical protein
MQVPLLPRSQILLTKTGICWNFVKVQELYLIDHTDGTNIISLMASGGLWPSSEASPLQRCF